MSRPAGTLTLTHVPPRSRARRGAVLLEVLVAITILGTSGVAAVTLVSESAHVVLHARQSERELERASAFLHAVALWSREDFDRRLGNRPQGEWRLMIQRPVPTIYTIVLFDSTSTTPLLRTAVYRPAPEMP